MTSADFDALVSRLGRMRDSVSRVRRAIILLKPAGCSIVASDEERFAADVADLERVLTHQGEAVYKLERELQKRSGGKR